MRYTATGQNIRACIKRISSRAHSAGFRCLRQHPLGEVQALLNFAELLPQLAHLDFERFYRFEHFERSQEFTPTEALPQALGP